MDSKKPIYKSIPFWVMVLFLFYSALGFLAVPYFIKKEITQLAATQLHSDLTVEKVSFNPFSFTCNLDKITLTDLDSQLWFSADKLLINIGLFKTLIGNTNISEISLDNPHYFFLIENNKGESQIKYPQIKAQETEQSKMLALDIANININQGSLSYLDKASENVIQLTFKTIGFNQINFSTDDINSQFDLLLITVNDDEAKISGQFNFAQLSSSGSWNLKDFTTQTIFKFISDKQQQFYGFANQDGILTANGSYNFDLNKQGLTDLSIDSLSLDDFRTQASNEQPSLSIKQLQLNDSQINLATKQISIQSIDFIESEFAAYFLENNSIEWDYLNNPINQTEQNTQTEESWQYQINQIKSSNLTINLNKLKGEQQFANTLLINNAVINNFNNEKQGNAEIKLTVIPDNSGILDFQAIVKLDPLAIESEISAKDINIVSSQAWLPNDIKMTIKQGTLSFNQKFKWANDNYNSSGWANLKNLNLLDENNQTFLKVEELKFSENNVDSATTTITLNNIMLDKAEGNLSVSANSKLNINSIIANQEDKQKIKDKIKNTKDDWIININQVELIDLQTNFIDHSIKPNFQSTLSKVNGSIKGLSSANTSKADLDIKGVLDTYGQFDIKGKINPLSEKAYTDLADQYYKFRFTKLFNLFKQVYRLPHRSWQSRFCTKLQT